MSRPLIALLSDFGTADHYVGTMKGVMLGICPEAALVDITHDVPPHDVRTGARQLAASYRYFPAGTVFLAVVDPGVGSSRRGIAVETADHRFVAPDNGLLSAVLDEAPARRVVELTERKFARATISRTFEGRDRFAPAAAWLAKGAAITTLGRSVAAPVRLEWPAVVERADGLEGAVEIVDRFGNLVTNLGRDAVERLVAQRRARHRDCRPRWCRGWSPPTPTSPRESCARSSEAATISRSPSAAAAPRRPSGSASAPRSG